MSTGIVAFEREYGLWIEEQTTKVSEIRTALQANISDVELQLLVDSCLNHYANLFRIKADAARADACYLLSGVWRTSTERLFQWIGGFCPSELLNLMLPHLPPLTDHQLLEVVNLRQSSQHAEDALSQGLEKVTKVLAERTATDITVSESTNYVTQMAATVENIQVLQCFVNQADHLRHETLRQMSKILTTRQVACDLLALGEYFHRLRAHSSLCPRLFMSTHLSKL